MGDKKRDTGQSEAALMEARRAKAARVRERGDNPFANDVDADPLRLSSLAEVRAACESAKNEQGRYDADKVEPKRFKIAGRVLFFRSMGAIAFMRLRGRTGELQLYFDREKLGDAGMAGLDDLDLGDFVEGVGTTMATKRGELSVNAESFRLITKAYRPLPTKTSFKDVEARYRRRYVDLVANPGVADVFKARTFILQSLRRFLDERAFLEVETPTMTSLIGGATATPFVTHHNKLDMRLFMRIAPELYLKRLVVGGFERVYEVGRNYRNEGISTRHNPEFTMLEYYQAYATYETLMDQTEEMLRFVDRRLAAAMPEAHAAWIEERGFTLSKFARVPMKEAIERALAAADLPADAVDTVDADDAPIKEWAKKAKAKKRVIDWANYRQGMKKCASDGERTFCAYEYVAEPFLDRDYRHEDPQYGDRSVPVFVMDHPFEVSPLARKKDADPSLVDRFELFIEGRELCNAFSELNDPEDQAARFQAQVDAKARGAEETMDYDHDYIRALEYGMPPAAGFGIGIDRLVMMLTGAPSIRDVILFPLLRPEGGPA